ncbi:hypothetical protein RSOLAG22IIIB_06099 [Rhizoctonia solani]|uniref:Uncharacterized protein n=1 Tax=Rhizoctonia solani TaxID=456999 RepID=A0A0K6GBX0_9AGAM|nr:hypothetical protein RSOLAG22IIIB_06099 [Rhizoctonia solani]
MRHSFLAIKVNDKTSSIYYGIARVLILGLDPRPSPASKCRFSPIEPGSVATCEIFPSPNGGDQSPIVDGVECFPLGGNAYVECPIPA